MELEFEEPELPDAIDQNEVDLIQRVGTPLARHQSPFVDIYLNPDVKLL